MHQPVLAIKETAPEKEYIGRPVKYQITVTNTGDTTATDTVVQKKLIDAVKFISASENGTFADNTIKWTLGAIEPQQSKTFEYVIQADNAGTATLASHADARCAKAAAETVTTQFSGIAAVLLEMVDVIDPILVGQDETYVIRVTNQGTATDTNIRVVAELEDTMQYVSSNGPTNGKLEGKKVIFDALPSLAPKEVATWNVIIKPTAAADARFGVRLQTDQTERPVVKTESTHYYK